MLAIDTSTRYAGVALIDAGQVLLTHCWFSKLNHTAALLPAIADALSRQGISCGDLDGIAVALGPGGFSSLRVGISAAKGLALAARKPLVAVGTLDLEAYPYLGSGLPVCAMLDAGRSEVAVGRYSADGTRVEDVIICPPDQLLGTITETTLFCGDSVVPWLELIKETLGNNAVVARSIPGARVWSLAEMGEQKLRSGEISDLANLQPEYIRMPSIGQSKRRDWAPQRS